MDTLSKSCKLLETEYMVYNQKGNDKMDTSMGLETVKSRSILHLQSISDTSDIPYFLFQFHSDSLSLLWSSYPLFCFCSPLIYYSLWPFILSLMMLSNTSCSSIMCWLSPICLIVFSCCSLIIFHLCSHLAPVSPNWISSI